MKTALEVWIAVGIFIFWMLHPHEDRREPPKTIDSGEQLLSYELFDKSKVTMSEVRDRFKHDIYGFGIFTEMASVINHYSREGFIRYLHFGREEDDNMCYVSVLLCVLLNLPYQHLWEAGYMQKKYALQLIEAVEVK